MLLKPALLSSLIILLFASCKKEKTDDNNPPGPQYPTMPVAKATSHHINAVAAWNTLAGRYGTQTQSIIFDPINPANPLPAALETSWQLFSLESYDFDNGTVEVTDAFWDADASKYSILGILFRRGGGQVNIALVVSGTDPSSGQPLVTFYLENLFVPSGKQTNVLTVTTARTWVDPNPDVVFATQEWASLHGKWVLKLDYIGPDANMYDYTHRIELLKLERTGGEYSIEIYSPGGSYWESYFFLENGSYSIRNFSHSDTPLFSVSGDFQAIGDTVTCTITTLGIDKIGILLNNYNGVDANYLEFNRVYF